MKCISGAGLWKGAREQQQIPGHQHREWQAGLRRYYSGKGQNEESKCSSNQGTKELRTENIQMPRNTSLRRVLRGTTILTPCYSIFDAPVISVESVSGLFDNHHVWNSHRNHAKCVNIDDCLNVTSLCRAQRPQCHIFKMQSSAALHLKIVMNFTPASPHQSLWALSPTSLVSLPFSSLPSNFQWALSLNTWSQSASSE